MNGMTSAAEMGTTIAACEKNTELLQKVVL
jgi:hypothetical protein